MGTFIGILIIVLIIWLFFYRDVENYRQCYSCSDDYRMLDGGMVVSNPFIWPYSGTQDVGKIYQLSDAMQSDFGFTDEPLIHLNTPDHVLMT